MKNYNKLFAAIALGGFMVSCADQDIPDYKVEKPESITNQEYLLKYDNIKNYVDRAAYPNFKIAAALGADDYNKKGVVYRVANLNFDEVTLGNAMKYASVVGDDGSMNFNTISEFLDNAEAAGMSVYGHTLAWHAQQNTNWLKNKVLDDHHYVWGPDDRIPDQDNDFTSMTEYPFTLAGKITPTMTADGLYANCTAKTHKFYIAEDIPTTPGETYEIKIRAKANKVASLPTKFGVNDYYKINVSEEWKVFTFKQTATEDFTNLVVDPGNLKLELTISSVEIGHYPPESVPQTAEEMKESLIAEMNRWCNGMMEACAGRVKAWDLINEAISGGGNINGFYDLQHDNGSGDFFWQDYFGNEEYGPIVEKAAREAYKNAGGDPNELKLFINDYNLESDWDNNHKVRSLIYWVNVWEAGGAKIDGVSSQMHISYYEDVNTMKSKARAYINMLKIMANSGKLVRISELDMGYVDIWGTDVSVADITPEQQQNMANYYRFIIQAFLKIVPKEQQYGIAQWCLTDAPANSGWRADTPVGLWTLDWARKPAYAAFCEALEAGACDTEDFFEFLDKNGLKHYITPDDDFEDEDM